MKSYLLSLIVVFTLLGGSGLTPLFAQEQLAQETDYPNQLIQPSLLNSTVTARRQLLTLTLPFFDDFSDSGLTANPNRWYIYSSVQKTITSAIRPPSIGTLRFDGLNSSNQPHLLGNPPGYNFYADTLLSHYLDLSAYSPADSIYLTFALQRGGRNDAPERNDSFLVAFRDTTSSFEHFVTVFADTGFTVSPFRWVKIPITNPAFFHSKFQIRFRNYGSTLGMFDCWHLDYVYLNRNRSRNDTTFSDIAISELPHSIASPYTAIPLSQFNGVDYNSPLEITVRNLSNVLETVQIEANLTDWYGNPLSGSITANNTIPIPAGAPVSVLLDSFDNQTITLPLALLQTEIKLSATNDTLLQNNEWKLNFRVDSILAYDDGEAESAYGMVSALDGLAFGQRFYLQQPDTLSAVWIYFARTPNVNAGKSFRLLVWKKAHRDSVLYEKFSGVSVQYSDTIGQFIRYGLEDTVIALPDTFIVGIIQTDNVPIGVGYDLNYNNNAEVLRDSSRYLVPSTLNGTLMVRPELRRSKQQYVSRSEHWYSQLQVYPNPVRERIRIQFPADLPIEAQIVWRNVLGQIVQQENIPQGSLSQWLQCPEQTGFYLLQIQVGTQQMSYKIQVCK